MSFELGMSFTYGTQSCHGLIVSPDKVHKKDTEPEQTDIQESDRNKESTCRDETGAGI